MSGTLVRVDVQNAEVLEALRLVAQRMSDPRPALMDAGEYLQLAVERRFREERDPEGREWAPLSGLTLANKRNDKILTESGGPGLRGSINYRVTGNQLEQGTNKIYGAIHQLGGVIRPRNKPALLIGSPRGMQRLVQRVTIPARPYLGISEEDASAISSILLRHAMNRK